MASSGNEAMTEEKTGNQAFILKTKSGQWKYEIWINGEEIQAAAGYENQFDAIEDALENNQHLEDLAMLIQDEK
jgi:hypothetical protein